MNLTQSQLAAIKSFIDADGELSVVPNTTDGADAIAQVLNAVRSPEYWVWRTSVTKHEYTRQVSQDGTVFSWSVYIGRSQGERDGWREMFNTRESVDPSQANVRQGFADIFSGAGGAAQRTHMTAVSRRRASVVEWILRTNTAAGTSGAPDNMGAEGPITYQEVYAARNP